jgi:hypothetical protein
MCRSQVLAMDSRSFDKLRTGFAGMTKTRKLILSIWLLFVCFVFQLFSVFAATMPRCTTICLKGSGEKAEQAVLSVRCAFSQVLK